jgi:predicted nucleic acid-binding Zn ribbon protein
MTDPTRRPHKTTDGQNPAGCAGRRSPEEKRRGMERLSDLLPQAAREFGLEDQLEQAMVAAAWLEIVAQSVPAAAGACHMIGLDHGTVTVAASEPIVAQEIRLRSPELLAALRTRTGTPLRQLRVVARHV